jgi:hypothetical protein
MTTKIPNTVPSYLKHIPLARAKRQKYLTLRKEPEPKKYDLNRPIGADLLGGRLKVKTRSPQ